MKNPFHGGKANGHPVGNVRIGRRYTLSEKTCISLWEDSLQVIIDASPKPKTLQEVYEELFGPSDNESKVPQ